MSDEASAAWHHRRLRAGQGLGGTKHWAQVREALLGFSLTSVWPPHSGCGTQWEGGGVESERVTRNSHGGMVAELNAGNFS